jgi:2-desacetyl-2-hydroxyethyl bacteriochlorophyllide A dehydrogenase
MRALAITGERKTELIETENPALQPGEIKIRISVCLLCTYEQRLFAGTSGPIPVIPGHEAAGEIVEIHPETATSFTVGQRVVFKTLDHCGHCSYCYTGNTNLCTGTAKKRFLNGIPSIGGLSEYINMDVSRVFPVSSTIAPEYAAFTEPLACCLHSVKRAGITFGDTAVIFGAGVMGLLHLKLTLLQGARVIVVEPDAGRRETAVRMGATHVFDPSNRPAAEQIGEIDFWEGADAVFVTTRFTKQVSEGTALLRKGGRLVLYGSFHPNSPVEFDPNGIHYSEIVVTGSYSPATEDFYRASRMLSYGIIDVSPLLSAVYPMEEGNTAFEAASQPTSFRVGIQIVPSE